PRSRSTRGGRGRRGGRRPSRSRKAPRSSAVVEADGRGGGSVATGDLSVGRPRPRRREAEAEVAAVSLAVRLSGGERRRAAGGGVHEKGVRDRRQHLVQRVVGDERGEAGVGLLKVAGEGEEGVVADGRERRLRLLVGHPLPVV